MRTTVGVKRLSPDARTLHADPVEDGPRPAIPEVVEGERGVDHRRRVARLRPARVDALDVEHRVGDHDGLVPDRAGLHADELPEMDPLGRHDVVDVPEHGRVPIGGIGELVRWKVRRGQLVVRAAQIDRRVGIVCPARVQLVDRAGIGARAEVTGRARLHAVAAHLHVPEERFAERHGALAVANVGLEVGGIGRANSLQ
jgi:hypothetical protein